MKGFTLVELIIAIAIAGIVISGVVVTSAELVKRTADPMLAVHRLHIAQAYLEEIEAQDFKLPGAGCIAPADRQDYTKICHYDVLNNTPVTDQFGNVPTGLDNYTVSVDVSSAVTGDSKLGPSGGPFVLNEDTALVKLTVTSPDGSVTILSGYFVNGS